MTLSKHDRFDEDLTLCGSNIIISGSKLFSSNIL